MYSRSVGALFDYFQRNYGNKKSSSQEDKGKSSVVPLVINTHGWIKGTFEGYWICHVVLLPVS
jgi:hypothetical protein